MGSCIRVGLLPQIRTDVISTKEFFCFNCVHLLKSLCLFVLSQLSCSVQTLVWTGRSVFIQLTSVIEPLKALQLEINEEKKLKLLHYACTCVRS